MKSTILFILAVIVLILAIWQNTAILYVLACCCIAIAIPLLPAKTSKTPPGKKDK